MERGTTVIFTKLFWGFSCNLCTLPVCFYFLQIFEIDWRVSFLITDFSVRRSLISRQQLELLSRLAREATDLTGSGQKTWICSSPCILDAFISYTRQWCMSIFYWTLEQIHRMGLLQLWLWPGKAWCLPQVDGSKAEAGRAALLACPFACLHISLPCPSGPFLALQQHLVDSLCRLLPRNTEIRSVIQSLPV